MGKAAAHEAVKNYREPSQPNPGCNDADAVRSARPKGKKCREITIHYLEKGFFKIFCSIRVIS